jgi:hypothetical protein
MVAMELTMATMEGFGGFFGWRGRLYPYPFFATHTHESAVFGPAVALFR